MYKFIKNLFCLLLLVSAFSACRKQALDAFYNRPATLAPPIYQTLQARGNFTNLLACIDKAGYTNILSTSGYWTMFAPDDSAFHAYFTANNISSVSQIDVPTATKIVTYSLAYSGYTSTPLNNFTGQSIEIAQSGLVNGLVPTGTSAAYKRKTVYHDPVDTTTVPNIPAFGHLAGRTIKVATENENYSYDYKDFNNKYIPYFTPYYFGVNGLQTTDYTYFFPNSTFTNSATNFNVLGGNVVNGNIICENGVIQEINVVPLPLPSLEKALATNPNYSHFYNFMQQYGGLVSYVYDPNATANYDAAFGKSDSVFVKEYSNLLGESGLLPINGQNVNVCLPNENLTNATNGNSVAQGTGYTLFAPTNAAFDYYANNVLLQNYTSLANLPQSVVIDFINAHLAATTIWPSQFNLKQSQNINKENPRFVPGTSVSNSPDIYQAQVCSNGLFYGTNKVQVTNVFSSVFGRLYLDPNYSLMTALIRYKGLQNQLSSQLNTYTLIMIPDVTLKALGYSYNPIYTTNASTVTSGIIYNAPVGSAFPTLGGPSASVDNQLLRVIDLGIYYTPNNEMSSLVAPGMHITSGLGSLSPEYVKYGGNHIVAAGNVDLGTTTSVNPQYVTTSNGIVYYPSGNFSTNAVLTNTPIANSIGTDIFNKGQIAPVNGVGGDPYYMFYQFLKNTALWNSGTKAIAGLSVGTDYTILIPTNAAMQDAVNNGWLPSTGTGTIKTPNYAPSALADVNLVQNFILYHILKARQLAPDGGTNQLVSPGSNKYATLAFGADGNPILLSINVSASGMVITDGQNRQSTVYPVSDPVYSTTLADHAVINSISTYLQYYDQTSISAANPNPTKY